MLGQRGVEVAWKQTSNETEARWSQAVEAMGRIYTALGGEMFLDGSRKDGTVHTSPPWAAAAWPTTVKRTGW